jgi:hypothetical protein
LRGLWSQFLPAWITWMAIVTYLYSWTPQWSPRVLVNVAIAYLLLPIVGLYFSLRSRFVLLSWLGTLATCFLLPSVCWWLVYLFLDGLAGAAIDDVFPHHETVTIPIAFTAAGFFLWRLHLNLRRRGFVLR